MPSELYVNLTFSIFVHGSVDPIQGTILAEESKEWLDDLSLAVEQGQDRLISLVDSDDKNIVHFIRLSCVSRMSVSSPDLCRRLKLGFVTKS